MDVAEELLDREGTVDRAYVERRLDDWYHRLDRLYADIEGWLPDGWSMADGGTLRSYDDMMQRFDVPAQDFPVKTLLHGHRPAGRLEPRGLWIIGANGRVDLIVPPAHQIIVDRAESFERPKWTITPLRDRLNSQPLTNDTFRASFV